MNDKGHFYISIAKSIIRILVCIFGTSASLAGLSDIVNEYGYNYSVMTNCITFIFVVITVVTSGFGVAEVLGIFEEVADKR